MSDPFSYINQAYNLSLRKGMRVEYTGGGRAKHGTITGADGPYILIKLDGHVNSFPYHPTWELKCITDNPSHAIRNHINTGDLS